MPAGEVRDCILLGGEHRGKGYFLSLEKLGLLLQVTLRLNKVPCARQYPASF